MYGILREALFNGPPRGPLQLVLSLLVSGFYFFMYTGRRGGRHPSFFEQFQSGNPSDFAVLVGAGMLIWIGFSIAILITDFRNSGRLW